MLSYQTALKLKEAGFPQKHILVNLNGQMMCLCGSRDEGDVHIPTLEELIEACGEHLFLLHREIKTKNWAAWGLDKFICDGNTPSEAVANLYLELYKK